MIDTAQIISELEECEHWSQEGHIQADKILCDLLIQLGYDKVVEAYEGIEKFYD
jgi:hypothetical protein